MKITINVIRIFVGLLFIFSGLVKANDPLGTAYKMEEYFEVWTADLSTSSFFLKNALLNLFHFFNEHTLFLSVTMNAFEIIAGAALLLGWRMKLFVWLLLLLMIFFTILTGYTFKTGKPTNCGCFGDCIKITPEFSFYKDVLLSALILILLFARKHIKPLFSPGINTALMLLAAIFSFGLQWYALKYLPPVDCLPYKKGKNISAQMKMPANAIPDSTVITFAYEKDGKPVEFTASQFPDDFNDSIYTFKKRYDKLIRKGKNNVPPITGFVLTGATGEDSTQAVLSQPQAILFYCMNFSVPVSKWKEDFKELYTTAKAQNIPVYIVTGLMAETRQRFSEMGILDIQIFNCDNTAIRTAARTNPCVYLLKQGTIIDKQSYKNIDKIKEQIK